MAEPMRTIDVASQPELLALVEEVQREGRPCLLKRGDEEVAVIAPVERATRPRRRRRRIEWKGPPTAAWWDSITDVWVDDEGPTDMSTNKNKYLAEAYEAEFR